MNNEAALKELERQEEVWEQTYDKEINKFGATHLFVETLKKGISNDYTDEFYEHLACLEPEDIVDIIKEAIEGETTLEQSLTKHANDFSDVVARNIANQAL